MIFSLYQIILEMCKVVTILLLQRTLFIYLNLFFKMDNKWYEFNDASVTPISEQQVVTKMAYLLFYKIKEN